MKLQCYYKGPCKNLGELNEAIAEIEKGIQAEKTQLADTSEIDAINPSRETRALSEREAEEQLEIAPLWFQADQLKQMLKEFNSRC